MAVPLKLDLAAVRARAAGLDPWTLITGFVHLALGTDADQSAAEDRRATAPLGTTT